MLSVITHPAVELYKRGKLDSEEIYIACGGTAISTIFTAAAVLVNSKTCNLQPKWIWPAVALILTEPTLAEFTLEKFGILPKTDPTLVKFTLEKSGTLPKSDIANMGIILSILFLNTICFALLPRKVANIGLAAALPLAGSVALANYFFNS